LIERAEFLVLSHRLIPDPSLLDRLVVAG